MLAQPETKTRNSLQPAWGHVPAGSDQALKRLVRAAIIQAAHDALKTDMNGWQAQQWLLSEDCAIFCEYGGVNLTAVRQWAAADCPDWRKKGVSNE
jgi:hypothetical protein